MNCAQITTDYNFAENCSDSYALQEYNAGDEVDVMLSLASHDCVSEPGARFRKNLRKNPKFIVRLFVNRASGLYRDQSLPLTLLTEVLFCPPTSILSAGLFVCF